MGFICRIVVMVAVPTFPAISIARTLIVFEPGFNVRLHVKLPLPSEAETSLRVTIAILDKVSLSVPAKVSDGTTTFTPFAGDVTVTIGGVLSMFKLSTAVAVFPAASMTVPETICFAPSVAKVDDGGQLTTPESKS